MKNTKSKQKPEQKLTPKAESKQKSKFDPAFIDFIVEGARHFKDNCLAELTEALAVRFAEALLEQELSASDFDREGRLTLAAVRENRHLFLDAADTLLEEALDQAPTAHELCPGWLHYFKLQVDERLKSRRE
jgi:hypothetical protein